MMDSNNNFMIFLDIILYDALQSNVIKNNQSGVWNIKLEKEVMIDVEYSKITDTSIDLQKEISLGRGICHTLYNWNREIENRIKDRSALNFLGKRIFEGTDEEKTMLDDQDKRSFIKFSPNYFDHFISNTKNINRKLISSFSLDRSIFKTDLGYPDTLSQAVYQYNNLFNTSFEIIKIELLDQMYFAEIKAFKSDMIDVFCLGFLVGLKDEFRNEKLRGNNTKLI